MPLRGQELVCKKKVFVSLAWSDIPVPFSIRTVGRTQVVAFYDEHRQLTVALRTIDEAAFQYVKLDQWVGSDSHNGIALGIDPLGQIHLAANMHASKMAYYRSSPKFDLKSFKRYDILNGNITSSVTYPEFLRREDGHLFFMFRDGKSGAGSEVIAEFDNRRNIWKNITENYFLSGTKNGSPYIYGPVYAGDGAYHAIWTWRKTRFVESTHDIYYAQSRDLKHWFAYGKKLNFPIKEGDGELVEEVPVGLGLTNINVKLGIDRNNNPLVTFARQDENGFIQVFLSRKSQNKWVNYRASDLKLKWSPSGGGSIEPELVIYPPKQGKDGLLLQDIIVNSSGKTCVINNDTYRFDTCGPLQRDTLNKQDNDGYPKDGLLPRVAVDQSNGVSPRYMLSWRTLPANRDVKSDSMALPSRLYVMPVGDNPC